MPAHHSSLLLKIDAFLLSYCCLMYFTNCIVFSLLARVAITPCCTDLDRSNVSNAYVSGMKEELNMQGTDFNKINTIFTCGYIIGMIPNNIALLVIPPRIWFPLMQIIWGVFTFCTSAVHDVNQLYAIRFFQGMAESSTFVGTHYILGSWYRTEELGKRSALFTCSGLVGTLVSGVLQGGIYRRLNGVNGRSGWRWLFIVDGVITLPIAFYGFCVFPNLPGSPTKAFYLSQEEWSLASERLRGRVEVQSPPLSWKLAWRVLRRWRWYACSLLFAVSGETESFGSNNLMGQWLKAIGGYTVEQIDYYPSGVTAVAIISTFACATLTDRNGVRWPVLVVMSVACIVASICILVGVVPIASSFLLIVSVDRLGGVDSYKTLQDLAGASYAGQATTFAWGNQICADDPQERAIVIASMNMWNNVVNAWWSIVFYPATDAPRFRNGMIAMLGICAATLMATFLVWYLEQREKQQVYQRTDSRHEKDTDKHIQFESAAVLPLDET